MKIWDMAYKIYSPKKRFKSICKKAVSEMELKWNFHVNNKVSKILIGPSKYWIKKKIMWKKILSRRTFYCSARKKPNLNIYFLTYGS